MRTAILSQSAARSLLDWAAVYMDNMGRPRKLPGKPRPDAANGGYALRELLKQGQKHLVRRDWATPYLARQGHKIAVAAVEAELQRMGHDSIEDYDDWEQDTRAVVRLLRRAQKAIGG